MKEKLRSLLHDWSPTGLITLGWGLASWGVGMISPPFGLITAGSMLLIFGVMMIRGGGDGHE